MSELIQVRKKSQVTLPQSFKDKLGIEEGDYLELQERNGEIILKVKKLIDKDQTWFWSERWQNGEKEAENDIRVGRLKSFSSAEESILYLHNSTAKNPGQSKKRVP